MSLIFTNFLYVTESELLEETSGLFRVATNDRDEDVLMIHYEGENETALPRMIRWNENGYAVPMLDDNSGDHGTLFWGVRLTGISRFFLF